MRQRGEIVKADGSAIAEAAAVLRAGGLVALPTETVYGLGANALDAVAVAKVFEAKGRPAFDPLIVHVASTQAARGLVAEWPAAAEKLAAAFWPGPLTVVLRKREVQGSRFKVRSPKPDIPSRNETSSWTPSATRPPTLPVASAAKLGHGSDVGPATLDFGHPLPDLVTSGLPNVAVRVPRHPVALRVLEAAGVPVAAPSANRFGAISPTRAEHVAAELGDRVDLILDGGPCETGVESTVVSLVGDVPVVLRLGGTPVEEIERVVGKVEVATKAEQALGPMASPGMLEQHYAPRTPLRLMARSEWKKAKLPGRPAFLCFRGAPAASAIRRAAHEVLSPSGDLREAAANLFGAMRRLDEAGVDVILAEPAPEEGLGRAINDRLRRAAAGRSA